MKFQMIGKEMWDMSKIPPGIQLYTLRNELEEDFTGTMKKVADMGYKTIEFAGYYDIPSTQMRRLLNELGLVAISSHVDIDKLKSDLQGEINYALDIGVKYIVVPIIPKETFLNSNKFNQLVSLFIEISDELRRHGLNFVYHNHGHEFEKINGKFILDHLLERVGEARLALELDVYWIKKVGLDPIKVLQYYRRNVPLLHVKDIDQEGETTEVGEGLIYWPKVFQIARNIGVKFYFVEQDISRHPVKSAKKSLDYLKSIGLV